jgi:hypothetical protein
MESTRRPVIKSSFFRGCLAASQNQVDLVTGWLDDQTRVWGRPVDVVPDLDGNLLISMMRAERSTGSLSTSDTPDLSCCLARPKFNEETVSKPCSKGARHGQTFCELKDANDREHQVEGYSGGLFCYSRPAWRS